MTALHSKIAPQMSTPQTTAASRISAPIKLAAPQMTAGGSTAGLTNPDSTHLQKIAGSSKLIAGLTNPDVRPHMMMVAEASKRTAGLPNPD